MKYSVKIPLCPSPWKKKMFFEKYLNKKNFQK